MEEQTEAVPTPNSELQAIFKQWESYGKDSQQHFSESTSDTQPSKQGSGIAGTSGAGTTGAGNNKTGTSRAGTSYMGVSPSKITKSMKKYFDLPRRDFHERVAKNEAKRRLTIIRNNIKILYVAPKIRIRVRRRKPAKRVKKIPKSRKAKKPRKMMRTRSDSSYCTRSSCDCCR